MKELQGAIIIASAFQALLGYSGLMSVLSRFDSIIFMLFIFQIHYYQVLHIPLIKLESVNFGSMKGDWISCSN